MSKSPSKADASKVNDVKVGDISLYGSSRGRQRRDSAESSPKHQRRSLTKTSSPESSQDTKKQEPAMTLRYKEKKNELGASSGKDKRGSSIVVDVDSILDQLMGSGEFDEGSDEEEVKPIRRKPSPKQDSSVERFSTPPQHRNRNSKVMETAVTSRTMLVDKESPPTIKKTPPTPDRTRKPYQEEKHQPSYQRNKPPELSSLKLASVGKKEPLTNGQLESDEDNLDAFRMRTRSNALTKTDHHTPYKSKQESISENSLDVDQTQGKKSEVALKRSGSYSRRLAQMSGDKALGIFYHNRRSQQIDHEILEEAEKKLERFSSTERSDSASPQSPPARSSREVKGFSPIPQSPLVSKSTNFEQEKDPRSVISPTPPRETPAVEKKEEELEVRTTVHTDVFSRCKQASLFIHNCICITSSVA